MFRVRVDNGLTQRNAEERGEGEGEGMTDRLVVKSREK